MTIIALLSIIAIILKTNSKKSNLEYEIKKQNSYNIEYIKKGYYVNELENGKVNITIAMGERSTGGYEISIKNIKIKEEKVVIYVEEKSPAPTDRVTEAFTYPTVQVEFNKMPKNIDIKSIDEKYTYPKIK